MLFKLPKAVVRKIQTETLPTFQPYNIQTFFTKFAL